MIGDGRVVSSGLRAVVLALPLAVLPGLPAPYDQPKAWWLQVIVATTALAWLLERTRRAGAPSGRDPDRGLATLRGLLAAYTAWWALTTVISVVPGQSLLGSFDRGFGLLTVLAAIALFPLVQSSARTVDQARALIDAALLGSVPVCLLALGQTAGWDWLPPTFTSSTTAFRVHATLGQHLFLGSYLTLLVPLAAVRCLFAAAGTARVGYGALGGSAIWVVGVLALVRVVSMMPLGWPLLPLWGIVAAVAWDRVTDVAESRRARPVPSAGLFLALVVLQVVVLFLSGGRAPFLAAMAALAIVAVTFWRRRSGMRVRVAATGAFIVLALLVAVLVVARQEGSTQRTVPIIERLAMPSGSQARESVKDRLEVWAAIAGSLGQQLGGVQVVPDQPPRARSAVGYGLDTQSIIVESFVTARRGTQPGALKTRAVTDRAHDVFLDHLVTGGLVAVVLWIALIAAILVVGARQLRTGVDEDWTLRLGCLAAVIAHVLEGITGIETIVPVALFWIVAAVLTAPRPPSLRASTPRSRRLASVWIAGLVVVAAIGCFAVAATSVWLLGSNAYERGIALARRGWFVEAQAQFEYAARLVPGLPLPRIMAGEAGLRVAASERDPARRAELLHEMETFLATPHGGAAVSADVWLVRGRVALARAIEGEPQQLAAALAAFARADRLRPNDNTILGPWAVALLHAGRPAEARALGERAVRTNEEDWLAWAVIARASARLGDPQREEVAERQARHLVPDEARAVLKQLP